MSKKLELILESLLNEEKDTARELLHDYIVESARGIYQELVDEEECYEDGYDDEVMEDDEEMEVDFAADDMSDESPEMDDMDNEDSDDDELEDRIEDMETMLADLTAKFEALMGQSDEEATDEEGTDEEDFSDEELEELEESTEFTKPVKADMKDGADSNQSMFTKVPKKDMNLAGKPVSFVSSEEKGDKKSEGEKHTPTNNVDVDQKAAPKVEQKEKPDNKDSMFTKRVK